MAKRLTAERRNEIARLLVRDGNIKASTLAKHFNVSTETIRKDLIYLEEQGIAQKSYGGAMASNELIERPVALKKMENMDIKSAIANKALELIPEKGVILLDAGSTTYALAKLLLLRDDLTIFTNSIMALNLLSDSNNQVFALGGRVRGSSKGIVGSWAIQALKSLYVDIAFLGSDGFRNLSGPSTASYEESELKQAVIECCNRTVILTDNTKFQTNSLFQFCDWQDVYALVTNSSDSADFQTLAAKIGEKTKVLLVD
ncbi:DeoR/GlpR family DNA-binding transcription regulator [Bariatricus sp. SGI.154]|uniref:DeoR/GlpR family DNA-binding transcription regulator n=1 Tax=Bariatricus sp. SGI.154 TaxID=3420549 RepID=UPI003D01D52F